MHPPFISEALSGPGQALASTTRSFMEPYFDHDLTRVRVHTDAKAAESARAIGAAAYTVGEDIVFREGRYTPETPDGRSLLAHELTHVVQQRSGAWLQPKLVKEPAGGCGLCEAPTFVGTEVHRLVQSVCFPPTVRNEIPIGFINDPLNGDTDGILDLLELQVDDRRRTIEAYIGEIKPNNASGIKAGVRDLAYYHGAVTRYLKGGFPDHSVTVERLDIPPSPSSLTYIETQGCPYQQLEVEDARDGLYLYNCAPTRTESEDAKDCCGRKKEEEAAQALGAAQLAMQISSLSEGREKKERKRTSSTAIGLGASQAALLTRIAAAHVDVYGAFAEWAYTGMYWGTRGHELKETLMTLALGADKLANTLGYAVALSQDISIASDAEGEESTAGMRAELNAAIAQVAEAREHLGRKLTKAMRFSAIEKFVRLDREYDAVMVAVENIRDLTAQNDDSSLSLSLVVGWEEDAAAWLRQTIQNLLDHYPLIVKFDQKAWLQIRR